MILNVKVKNFYLITILEKVYIEIIFTSSKTRLKHGMISGMYILQRLQSEMLKFYRHKNIDFFIFLLFLLHYLYTKTT